MIIKQKFVAEAATYTNTQQTQETNIHALSGILTCIPSNQAGLDLRRTLCGHRN